MSFLIRHWKITRFVLLVTLLFTVLGSALEVYLSNGDRTILTVLLVVPSIAFVMSYLFAKIIPAMSAFWKRTLFPRLSITFFPKLYFVFGLIGMVGIAFDHRTLADGIGIPLGAIVGMLVTLGDFLRTEARESALSTPAAARSEQE